MKKRIGIIVVAAISLVLVGATYALGGGPSGLIWDDGSYVRPGSLDDGKELRSQTTISPQQATASARRAASGSLGQVDLEHYRGRIVYMVDVGDQEVRVDANDGSIAAISPRD